MGVAVGAFRLLSSLYPETRRYVRVEYTEYVLLQLFPLYYVCSHKCIKEIFILDEV